MIETGAAIAGEELSATLDDMPRHWIASASPRTAGDDPVTEVVLLLTELRDEHTRALALRDGEQRLRLALEGTDTGFFEWDVAADRFVWTDGVGPLSASTRRHAGRLRELPRAHPPRGP